MGFKEQILEYCVYILTYPDECETDTSPRVFVFNKYNLNIPRWVDRLISCCIGTNHHLSSVLFDELMNSISARKFNNGLIPSEYKIEPRDWTDCYEDGYPLLTINPDLLEYYNESYFKFVTGLSHDDLICLVLMLSHKITSYKHYIRIM